MYALEETVAAKLERGNPSGSLKVRLAQRPGNKGKLIVALLADAGDHYLSRGGFG